MQTFFTTQGILWATIVGFGFGALWYSPMLFINAWLKGIGMTKEHLPHRSKRYMATTMTYAFVAHGAIAATLATMFDIAEIDTLKNAVYLGLFLSFGFVATTRFIDMVYTVSGSHYEMRPQLNFLVSAGYYVCLSAVMSAVLFLVR
jgi:hypothetical protein